MFDLDQAITQWRRHLAVGAMAASDVLDELESHLREDIQEQVQSGSETELAFAAAVQRIGQAALLQCEFDKVSGTKETAARVKRAVLTLAGIPNQYPNPLMNTSNSMIEPRWATYAKA